MLHKFIDSFRGAGHTSGFEVYFMSLQKAGVPGAPSLEEARQDYRRITPQSWYLFQR